MDLLEYQAKEWFREMSIPVLPSQRIDHPSDLKRLKIPYPVVLKSQVHTGGRGRAGGVKFVANTIDAIAAAQTIFRLPILGELPEVLLAEAKYDADREFYLAVVLDAAARRPVILGSTQGGVDVELAPELLQQVVVDQEFSPFYARRLTVEMGLQGSLLQSVSQIVEKMYQMFIQKDLDLVEINPLGVSATGELMALDGKVTVNNRAIARHPSIAAMAEKVANREDSKKLSGVLENWDEVESTGNIGILGNGAGLVMATLDLVSDAGSKPATCLNVGHGRNLDSSQPAFCERLAQGLEFISQDQSIQVVLVNILGSVPTAVEIAEVIAKFIQQRRSRNTTHHRHPYLPRLVVRLTGSDLESATEQLAALEVLVVENLDEAVTQTVRLCQINCQTQMNLTPDSKVLIQGITEMLSSTHAVRMQAYGTNVLAGVNPGYGGQTLNDIPIFDLVEQALAVVGPIDTTIIFVPPYQVLDAALEAINAGIQQIIIISAGMPPLDMVHLLRKAEATETLVVGPNSPGIIVPGKILLGTHASEFYTPGGIGIVSRSSTLTYEIALEITKAGLGQSIGVSIGSDTITGSSFLQWLQILDEDESTEAIVLVGEPGGNSEEAAARYIIEAIDKPVIAYIAGCHSPVGKHWGHAGVLAQVVGRGGDVGTAQSKLAAFQEANVPIAERPSQIPHLLKKALKS